MAIATEPHPCFFYGSLMEPKVLNSVTRPGPEADLFTVRASIQGYIRYPYHNEPYPGMVASQDDHEAVEGLLVFGHTMMDRFRLDQFEGSEYTRRLLPVKVLDPVPGKYNVQGQYQRLSAGDLVQAYVYVFTGPREHLDTSRPWDFEAFQREHLAIWMQTSPDFTQRMLDCTQQA
ncbi:hypothetical protein BGZ70_009938 [Mortierella alpina]|uniref:Putative gamma-glutamylcyclotransferase n=1 Tax=Mortierella alpina TaxID=64518 RepID=A0A9P6LZY2_MORAP|nr:hypothetical protein BGZ70_009938 [Mortierella alpina]